MAPPSYHMDKDSVVLSLCAGSSIVKAQTIFSSDSKLLFCCSGLVIKVFNTNNGQCALQLRGHKNVVTGLALHPGNKLQLFSCGLDGLVNQWDFSDGVLLKSHDFHLPLHGLVCIDHIHGSIAVIAQRPHATNCSVLRLKLQKTGVKKKINSEERKIEPESLDEEDEHAETKQDILISVCSSDHRTVAYGCNGEYIAAVSGHELLVYSWKKRNLKKHTIDKENPFTCVACHPTETCLATGHTNGKIMFWWNFFTKDRKVTSTSHWHSLPVETLTFTPEGSYLLSGGHECVLVKWQVNTEQRDYLPRLGAPLCNISVSPDGTLYASCHTDNVIQLITSNFHIDFAIRGLARAHLGAEKPAKIIPAGLLLDPRSKALVTNGRPGHLQFFSLETDTQLYNLDIVGQNYISPESIKQPVTVTEVEQAAFDTQGEWLATFEHWDDGLMTPEYRLKFWCYNKKLQNYQLNTTVEQPHNKAITCMRFQPPVSNQAAQPPVLVTTSSDSTFKLWILVTEAQANKTIDRWTCESVGFYRNQPATTARFSEDGSVLAVAFLGTLTLWDPETNVMSAILSDSSHKEPIRFVEFGGRNCSHLIVTATTSHLTVWNLISLSVHWRVPITATVLVSNGDLMAVVSSDNDLFVFRPNKWSTLYSHPHLAEETILHAIFIPQSSADKVTMDLDSGALGWQQESRLYLFDSKQQLFTFDYVYNVASREKETSQSRVHLQQVLPETPFGALLGTTRSSQELNIPAYRPVGTVWHHKSSFVTEMLNTPAHSMPALHSICSQFIQSLLQKNASLKQDESEVKDSDDEVESAVETDDS